MNTQYCQHGISKRRTWRKLHLGVDEATGEILAAVVTTNDVHDGEVLNDVLPAIEGDIEQVLADGAYDHRHCYDEIAERGAKPVILPRKDAVIWQHGNNKALHYPHLLRDQCPSPRLHDRDRNVYEYFMKTSYPDRFRCQLPVFFGNLECYQPVKNYRGEKF